VSSVVICLGPKRARQGFAVPFVLMIHAESLLISGAIIVAVSSLVTPVLSDGVRSEGQLISFAATRVLVGSTRKRIIQDGSVTDQNSNGPTNRCVKPKK